MDEPIYFIENKGQWKKDIKYKAEINGGCVWLFENSFTFDFYNQNDIEQSGLRSHNENRFSSDSVIRRHAYHLKFIGTEIHKKTKGSFPATYHNNYFIGNNSAMWATNVQLFKEVLYTDLYRGINLLTGISPEGNFKYNLIVEPGADISQIKWDYEGIEPVLENNTIVLNSHAGKIIEIIPDVYQILNGKKTSVECKLNLNNKIVSLQLPNGYNLENELIIDPVVIFSTYSGSLSDNWGFTSTYDSNGNAYSCGPVITTGFPVSPGAFDEVYSSPNSNIHKCDIGIIKYSPDGANRLYATYLGGTESELPHSIIVDTADNLIVYGTTSSNNFPVSANAFDNTFSTSSMTNATQWFEYTYGSDIFVSKFNPNGNLLLGSTYVGGNGTDGFNSGWFLYHNYSDQIRGEVVVDKDNNIIVASTSSSMNFPTTSNSFSPNPIGGQDGVVFKLSSDLSNLIWSTFIGGTLDDCALGINVNLANDNIYVCGGTKSLDLPISTGAFQATFQGGNLDAYILALNQSDGSFLYGSYIGTPEYDKLYFIQSDAEGSVYVLGQSLGNFPITPNVYNNINSPQIILKSSAQLNSCIWSTQIGSGDNSAVNLIPTAFMVDKCNNIYLAGWGGWRNNGFGGGSTQNFPVTPDSFDPTTDGSDFYVMVLSKNAETLLYGSYIGGLTASGLEEHTDGGMSRFDPNGILYLTVCASCGDQSNFPTTAGVWSNVNASPQCNMALFKMGFDFDNTPTIASLNYVDSLCGFYYFQGDENATNHYWNFNDGSEPSNSSDPIHNFTSSGIYTVLYISSDSSTCGYTDTVLISINVNSVNALNSGNLVVPNVFSPNNDSYNENFKLVYSNFPNTNVVDNLEEYHLEIYNRWGSMVFESTDTEQEWNGKIKGDDASEGVYYYLLTYKRTCLDDQPITTQGYLTLLRN